MPSLQQVLEDVGYRLIDSGQYWRSNAIYRGGDNKTALSISKADGSFIDFVTEQKGSLDDLIKLTKGIDNAGLSDYYLKNEVSKEEIFAPRTEKIMSEKTWTEKDLGSLLPHYKFYEKRGITSDTQKFFHCGLAHSGKFVERITFPIFRHDGVIHGWSGRDVTGRKKAKWLHMGKTREWIYPAYLCENTKSKRKPVLEEIKAKKEVVLIESIGDAMSLYQSGVKNIAVIFGLKASSKLVSFLTSLEVDKIILAFNNDLESPENRGRNAAIKAFVELTRFFDVENLRISLPPKKDFGEMTHEEIEKWGANKGEEMPPSVYKEVLNYMRSIYKQGRVTKDFVNIGKIIAERASA